MGIAGKADLVLIDTSALIEFLNRSGSREDEVVERLIREDANIALADITVTEVLQGIKSEREYNNTKKSLLAFRILSARGLESYVAAADLYRACRSRGLTVRSTVDLLIARIAIENDAALLHKDHDFDAIASVSDLRISPTAWRMA